jgi:hypothetical protein
MPRYASKTSCTHIPPPPPPSPPVPAQGMRRFLETRHNQVQRLLVPHRAIHLDAMRWICFIKLAGLHVMPIRVRPWVSPDGSLQRHGILGCGHVLTMHLFVLSRSVLGRCLRREDAIEHRKVQAVPLVVPAWELPCRAVRVGLDSEHDSRLFLRRVLGVRRWGVQEQLMRREWAQRLSLMLTLHNCLLRSEIRPLRASPPQKKVLGPYFSLLDSFLVRWCKPEGNILLLKCIIIIIPLCSRPHLLLLLPQGFVLESACDGSSLADTSKCVEVVVEVTTPSPTTTPKPAAFKVSAVVRMQGSVQGNVTASFIINTMQQTESAPPGTLKP